MKNLLLLNLSACIATLTLKGLHKASSWYDFKTQSILKYCDWGANPVLLYYAAEM